MALIHLPQTKWGSGTGRQVILKGDFDKIEQALLEGFEFTGAPGLEYVDSATLRVNATADCRARVMMCGFPSPLARGQWVDGGLSDGRYRENAAPVTLNLATAGHLWGTEKSYQWYAVYALAGANDTIFSLKAMPVHAGGLPGRPDHHPAQQRQWGQHRLRLRRQRTGGGRPPDPQRRLPGAGPGHHRQQQRQRHRRRPSPMAARP